MQEEIVCKTTEAIRKAMPTNAEDRVKYMNNLMAATRGMFGNNRVITDTVETIIKQLKWCAHVYLFLQLIFLATWVRKI